MASDAYVASSPTVLASNHAIPGNCSEIIPRGVLQWRKFSRLALIWQASRQFQCILEYNIVYFFLGNLQICWETFNMDCRCSRPYTWLLCNMRASQLVFRDLAVQTLSASQAGRWEGCFPNCFFPHFVQILERAWICWWTPESRHFVLCFLSLIWGYKRGLMPQIVAANFIVHDPPAFEIVLAFPYMVRCKQFSELSSDENLQCKNL